ncbi:hypothetical protein [Bacillus sp. EB600]|uniref:hypothetical protein n=1 Tax=Bacillus sp. EB600 TaxID=2806345 RepID=UPI00210A3C06|nr:hypothetical protein [Bacillus sp. EB600]MCQ6279968.1 hypothetical protein [Bacillus sp. EB600]
MNLDHLQKFVFNMENDKGQFVVKGEVIGDSEIPLLDDVKFEAVIALLNSIDKKNFSEGGNDHLFDKYIGDIEETIGEMKKYNQFQGKINEGK